VSRPLIDVIGLPSPETCRRLVVLLGLAEPRKKEEEGAEDAA
jgi:hypothetical protein